jgi:hypothetical protein
MVTYATRECRKCHDDFPDTSEFFYLKRDKKGREYLDYYCKDCQKALATNNLAYLRPQVVTGQRLEYTIMTGGLLAAPVATLTCRVCHHSYAPLTIFWADCDLCVYCQEDGAKSSTPG